MFVFWYKIDWETIVLIVWWIWAITSFFRWIFENWQKRKSSLQIEKLKGELKHKNAQRIINDEKYRVSYEEFIWLLSNIWDSVKNKKELKQEDLYNLMKNFRNSIILFSWSKTLKAYSTYIGNCSDLREVLPSIWELLLSMRIDVGADNWKMNKRDMLDVFLWWKSKEKISQLKLSQYKEGSECN